MRKKARSFWTLSDLCKLSDEVFETSVTSTVLRYCQFDVEPCAMVVSEAGKVGWAKHSDSMKALGMSYIEFGSHVPGMSRTAELWERVNTNTGLNLIGDEVHASVWYERPYRERLWEDAMPLGLTGLVLTFLSVQDF